MGERGEILAGAASGAAGAALGAMTGNPVLAVVGAGLAPVGSAVLVRLGEGAMQAVQWLAERAARDGNVDVFIEYLTGRPASSALLLDAGQAIARTEYEVKVEAIGRAIAGGVLYEEGVRFDVEAAIVRAVCRVERPHVAVLEHLSRLPADQLEDSALPGSLPAYAAVMPSLLADLQSWGLAYGTSVLYPGRVSITDARATDLGLEVLQRFVDAGASEGCP